MSQFITDADAVDPEAIPFKTLPNGDRMPALGLGTFGSDNYTADQVAAAVADAAHCGYRHFDCAAVYGNEPEIGRSLQRFQEQGIKRENLWITSKVWNDRHGDVAGACRQSLRDLGLEYLDLYLVHWPFPNHHAPGVGVDARDPHAVPYRHAAYMETWLAMERLVEEGLVRHIGVSNMTIPKLELLLRDARVCPVALEMELHPYFQQPELFRYASDHQIIPIGYSPIGSPSRPARDRTPEDASDIEDPVILKIAERLQTHPAIVCIKWAMQRGQVPIPFSVKRSQYLSALRAATSEPLSADEMAQIGAIDRNNRLIKGQVFLWEGAKSWEDLWDPSGSISV